MVYSIRRSCAEARHGRTCNPPRAEACPRRFGHRVPLSGIPLRRRRIRKIARRRKARETATGSCKLVALGKTLGREPAGIGAVVLNGAVVEEGAQVGAGALVPPGKVVPAGWLVMGVPAKPIRKMSPAEVEDILKNARDYLDLWHRDYRGRG